MESRCVERHARGHDVHPGSGGRGEAESGKPIHFFKFTVHWNYEPSLVSILIKNVWYLQDISVDEAEIRSKYESGHLAKVRSP